MVWMIVDVSQKVKELRKAAKITQCELSIEADMSQTMVMKMEKGECRLSDKMLRNIARCFGVNMVDLFDRAEIEVEDISRAKADELLASTGDTYEPRGLFVVDDLVDGSRIYTAIQNLDGSAETEEFTTHRAAVNWLHGRNVGREYYYMPDKAEKSDDVEKLEKIANGGA